MFAPDKPKVADNVIAGLFSLVDERGGVKIADDVNVTSYVKLIIDSYNVNFSVFKAIFDPIKREKMHEYLQVQ